MNVLCIGYGYVGAYLVDALRTNGGRIEICDRSAAPTGRELHQCAYQDLTVERLAEFDTILWFAGHSNVSMSIEDPDGALANNCLDLIELCRRKQDRTRLIYASTASLYSVPHGPEHDAPASIDETQTRLNPINPYDCSKVAFDAMAACFAENVVGLRMGTVSGWSPRLRPELLFNAMNLSALRDGVVRVSNAHAWRSILFLDDLARIVQALMDAPAPTPKIVNCSSMSLPIGELAQQIAAFHGVPVTSGPDTRTYSFRVDASLAEDIAGPARALSLRDRCAEFARAYKENAA